jgi:hypothetical protein
MPIVHECMHPGCRTLTMGELCLEHERRRGPQRSRPRLIARKALLPLVALAAAAAAAVIRSRFQV